MKAKNIREMLVLQLILLSIGVLAILLIKTDIINLIPPCMVREAVGMICPTCGVTRCVSNILSLNFRNAFMYHPMFFILIFYLIFIDIIYIINTVFNKKIFRFLYPSLGYLAVFLVLFFLQYFYRLYMIFNFNSFRFL